MDENNFLTAEEARAIADSSQLVKKRIYKLIKEVANAGSVAVQYDIENASGALVQAIAKDLRSRGYKVDITHDEDDDGGFRCDTGIQISWNFIK